MKFGRLCKSVLNSFRTFGTAFGNTWRIVDLCMVHFFVVLDFQSETIVESSDGRSSGDENG